MNNDAQNQAEKIYSTICDVLQNVLHWNFRRDDEKMHIFTTAVGKDLSMPLHIIVSAQRKLAYVKSPMPFSVAPVSRKVVGRAVNVANFSMLNGCFEYNEDSGALAFRTVLPFDGCEISAEVCKYIILLSCQMTDKFNDKFLALSTGEIDLDGFKAFAYPN